MNKRLTPLILATLLAVTFITYAFIPKSTSTLCLYVHDTNGNCVYVGKVNAGSLTVTGKLLSPNSGGVCPPAPSTCDEQVDIEQQ